MTPIAVSQQNGKNETLLALTMKKSKTTSSTEVCHFLSFLIFMITYIYIYLTLYGIPEDNSAPRGWGETDGEAVNDEDFGGRRALDEANRSGDENWDSDGESIGEVDEEMAAAVERELFS